MNKAKYFIGPLNSSDIFSPFRNSLIIAIGPRKITAKNGNIISGSMLNDEKIIILNNKTVFSLSFNPIFTSPKRRFLFS